MARLTEELAPTTTEGLVKLASESTTHVLSDDEILNSNELQRSGAIAGDKIVDGKLVREVSTEPRGTIISRQDLINSPQLIEAGAEPGDMIENGQLIKSGDNDALRNFEYLYEEATGPIKNLSNYLTSKYPLPEVTFNFTDPLNFIDIHFDDPTFQKFKELSEQERRDFLIGLKQKELDTLREDFEPEQATVSGVLGTVAGSVDPSIALPIGRTLIGTTVGGGLYGAGFEATEQLARQGEVTDYGQVGFAAGIGAVAAPTIQAITNGAGRLAQQAIKPLRNRASTRKMQEINNVLHTELAAGSSLENAIIKAKKDLKLSDEEFATYVTTSDELLANVNGLQKAKQVLEDEIANDSPTLRMKSDRFSDWVTILSTEISSVSKVIGGKLRNYDSVSHAKTGTNLKEVEPFMEQFKLLPDLIKKEVTRHLNNRNYDAAKALARQHNSALVKEIDNVQNTLKKFKTELSEILPEAKLIDEGFFPRYTTDYTGLTKTLNAAEKTQLKMALRAVAKSRNKGVADLTEPERIDIINKIAQGYKISYANNKLQIITPAVKAIGTGSSPTKARQITTVTPEMMPYYANADEALSRYIRRATDFIEKKRFFGAKNIVVDETGSIDINQSVAKLLNDELQKGNITDEGFDRLVDLIQVRFGAGEKSIGDVGQFIRDLGYAGTIGNPISALTQLGDLFTSAARYGLRNSVAAMVGPRNIKIADVAIERVASEFDNPNKLAKRLDQLFTAVGFKAVDQLGKETILNASLRKFQGLAKSDKGKAQLREEYKWLFGDDIESVLADLKDGIISDNVKAMSFSALADIQPVTRSEMAVNYLRNATGPVRLMYLLKSFTLKMYDLVRRDVYQKAKEGKVKEAATNATLLLGYLAAANVGTGVIKDVAQGREVDPTEIPDRALWSLLGVFGLSKYTSERYLERGDVVGAVTNQLVPATPVIEAVFTTFAEGGKAIFGGEPNMDRLAQQARSIPGIGPLLYAWFLGGAEKYNEREDQRKRKEAREERKEALGLK